MQFVKPETRRNIALQKCLNWLDLRKGDLGLHTSNKDEIRLKKIVELLIICSAFKKKFNGIANNNIKSILSFVTDIIEQISTSNPMIRHPDQYFTYLRIYYSLNECEVGSPFLKGSADRVAQIILKSTDEQLPYKNIETHYLLNKVGLIKKPKLPLHLIKRTFFYNNPSPFFMSDKGVYHFTHEIFYLSDFGFINIPRIYSNRKSFERKCTIFSLMQSYLYQKNWDLLAELLICCYCLRWFPYPLYEICWSNLLNSQLDDGTILGPYFDNKEYSIRKKKDKLYYTNRNYHTTLVTALACIVSSDDSKYFNQNNKKIFPKSKKNVLCTEKNAKLVCDRIYQWLRSLNRSYTDIDANTLIQSIVGEWLYNKGINCKENREIGINIHRTLKKLNTILKDPTHNILLTCDPRLIFIVAGILKKLNLKNKIIMSRVDELYNILSEYLSNSNSNKEGLFDLYFISGKLEYHTDDVLDKFSNLTFMDIENIENENQKIDYISSYVSAITHLGRKEISERKYPLSSIWNSLSYILVKSMCRYNLAEGLRILRIMNYLNQRKCLEDSLDFMFCQQQNDGKLGFYDPQISKLKSTLKFDSVKSLYLPVAIMALWTFTEIINPQFRLIDSI